MGYKVLGRTEELLKGYGPRKGLEGPFVFIGGIVLYYDPVEGRYWDPTTDFYMEHDDMSQLQNRMFEALRGQ